ncbi:MAG: succinate dehydrogenase, cytochrome b556 subunit [Gammaproteobacteria bacterium]|nr:MAG: succinate dehydrogenase, cytochrome b556 subunit [Gammaproteobacteria bacterium]
MSQGKRPLSPHLEIYRPLTGSFTSILHRATNTALFGGLLVLAVWMACVAAGGEVYQLINEVLSSYFGRIALFGWTFSAIFSSAQWVRHFFWDLGYGFDVEVSKRSGLVAVGVSAIATLGIWATVIARGVS